MRMKVNSLALWASLMIVGVWLIGSGCAAKEKEDFWDTSRTGKKVVVGTAKDEPETMPMTQTGGTGEAVSFANDIMPVFEDNCLKCHEGTSAKADVDLSTTSGILRSQIVVPSRPQESSLVQIARGQTVTSTRTRMGGSASMGPGGTEEPITTSTYQHTALARQEVTLIENWIKAGCPNN